MPFTNNSVDNTNRACLLHDPRRPKRKQTNTVEHTWNTPNDKKQNIRWISPKSFVGHTFSASDHFPVDCPKRAAARKSQPKNWLTRRVSVNVGLCRTGEGKGARKPAQHKRGRASRPLHRRSCTGPGRAKSRTNSAAWKLQAYKPHCPARHADNGDRKQTLGMSGLWRVLQRHATLPQQRRRLFCVKQVVQNGSSIPSAGKESRALESGSNQCYCQLAGFLRALVTSKGERAVPLDWEVVGPGCRENRWCMKGNTAQTQAAMRRANCTRASCPGEPAAAWASRADELPTRACWQVHLGACGGHTA